MYIDFQIVKEHGFNDFRNDVKTVFSIAVIQQFGKPQSGEIISDNEIERVLYAPKAVAYFIYLDGKKIGGIALGINNETHRNSLDLFYIYPNSHGKGLGYRVWQMIEDMYPQTEVWELVTPYFEKRNIH